MKNPVCIKIFDAPPVCESEILRYSGCKDNVVNVLELVSECIEEAKNELTYVVCYTTLDLKIIGDECDFGLFKVRSSDLSKNLSGCNRVIVFAATVGFGIDRLISRYSRVSPSKALMMQSLGTERIEALCDEFCRSVSESYRIKRRFSSGYGDLPLDVQNDIFSVLDCTKRIGVVLNDSLLMSPSKSVTAFVGIYN